MSQKAKEQESLRKRLKECLRAEGNDTCADCGNKMPRWASVNIGVLICSTCAGIHRSLGVHISRVRSIELDTWNEDAVSTIERNGNERVNAQYEANLTTSRPKINDATHLGKFINDKYVNKSFFSAKPQAEPKQPSSPTTQSPKEEEPPEKGQPACKHEPKAEANLPASSIPPPPKHARTPSRGSSYGSGNQLEADLISLGASDNNVAAQNLSSNAPFGGGTLMDEMIDNLDPNFGSFSSATPEAEEADEANTSPRRSAHQNSCSSSQSGGRNVDQMASMYKSMSLERSKAPVPFEINEAQKEEGGQAQEVDLLGRPRQSYDPKKGQKEAQTKDKGNDIDIPLQWTSK